MRLWLIIIGMGAITYALRLSLITLLEGTALRPLFRQALRFVPTAVLSAIIFPELLQPGGVFNLSPGNARLLAGILAAVIAWRSKNVLFTIIAGMIVLWLLQSL